MQQNVNFKLRSFTKGDGESSIDTINKIGLIHLKLLTSWSLKQTVELHLFQVCTSIVLSKKAGKQHCVVTLKMPMRCANLKHCPEKF